MILDGLLDFLKKYRESFPHRNIEIRGELALHHDDLPTPTIVKLDTNTITLPLERIESINEIKSD